MSEQRGSARVLALLTSGLVIGAVEVILAVSFASLVFGGYLVHLSRQPWLRSGASTGRS